MVNVVTEGIPGGVAVTQEPTPPEVTSGVQNVQCGTSGDKVWIEPLWNFIDLDSDEEEYPEEEIQSQQYEEKEEQGSVTQEPTTSHSLAEIVVDDQIKNKIIILRRTFLHKNQHPHNQLPKLPRENLRKKMLLHKNQHL